MTTIRDPGGGRIRGAVRILSQPRYAALTALMVLVAIVCVAAGTWQILRFEQKVRENDDLTANAHAAPAPVASVLPLVGRGDPASDAVEFRPVTATGTYLPERQALVRLRSVDGVQGFYVLTPLRTPTGVLLVARGFVAPAPSGDPPVSIAAPPAGRVTITGRVRTSETRDDAPPGTPTGQLAAINADDQAARLARPVRAGYVELLARQPGASGLVAIPAPDLSNPAGGALEPQHFAYVVQWYIFAVLALAAPFAMSRAERREQEGVRPTAPAAGAASPGAEPPLGAADLDARRRAAKLTDRYGRAVR